MEEFRPEELAWFLDDLYRPPGRGRSLMCQLCQASGYQRFLPFFDPFQYERDARAVASRVPDNGEIVAILYPKDRYSARLYQLRGSTAEPSIRYDRRQLGRLLYAHPGFRGLAGRLDLEMDYRKDPAARVQFEKSLTLVVATALFRTIGARSGGVYFMEKGWSSAYRLNRADRLPQKRRVAATASHGA